MLDFDSTADPTHGDQEQSAYHGYHRQRMYHPLLVFDGETNQLVTAVLRGGATHASKDALAILKRVVGRIRRSWDCVEIEIRTDAGFAVPEIYVRRMQLDTLRLLLVKIGGRVRQMLTKTRLYLASGHPGQHLWHALYAAQPSPARE